MAHLLEIAIVFAGNLRLAGEIWKRGISILAARNSRFS